MIDAPPSATDLHRLIERAIAERGGWLPFDEFMRLALYAPALGYYTSGRPTFGLMPSSGSDFVTAPELSPLFGRAVARQVRQALAASGTDTVWEFGAGSGALALQLLDALGDAVRRYVIVDLSGTLRGRQQERLRAHAARVEWLDVLPEMLEGVIVGNEVLDAMPVQLLHFDGSAWWERGVALERERFVWRDGPTTLRPPIENGGEHHFVPGTVTEIHPQAQAFIATLAARLQRGAAFFFDYGFPESEYYHPQRIGGTLMCHRAHRADTDPLVDVGAKDITSHLDFTALAVAAQDAGAEVIGYTNQAWFLMNCGMLEDLQDADLPTRTNAQKLLTEHEMGELFKVLAFARGPAFDPIGFRRGDRRHML